LPVRDSFAQRESATIEYPAAVIPNFGEQVQALGEGILMQSDERIRESRNRRQQFVSTIRSSDAARNIAPTCCLSALQHRPLRIPEVKMAHVITDKALVLKGE